jgi:hypothetical protein
MVHATPECFILSLTIIIEGYFMTMYAFIDNHNIQKMNVTKKHKTIVLHDNIQSINVKSDYFLFNISSANIVPRILALIFL